MILNVKNREKKLSNNILSLSQVAKAAKEKNKEVINSTIGMLADEDNNFYTFEAVKLAMKDLSTRDMFSYSDTDGGARFAEAIKSWVFGNTLDTFVNKCHLEVIATPGGSGAITTVFSNYLNKGDKVILPNNMWETYITFAKERECSYLTYNLFDEKGGLDLDSIKKQIDSLVNQETVVLVINDPCQNPTGFCMTDEEYQALVVLLNSYERNIVLLMDVAYFDFYNPDGNIIRKRYSLLTDLNANILTVFAFSGSKTFGLYGLRIGAAIGVSKNIDEVKAFKQASEYTARGYWSSSSTLGIALINELVLNDKYRALFQSELKMMSEYLEKRAKVFIDESFKCGLKLLPFKRGFFLCVPTHDPVGLMNSLHLDNCYVVVTKTCIRIALCAISVEEAKKLPRIIREKMEAGGF